jgi:hypothetical protein
LVRQVVRPRGRCSHGVAAILTVGLLAVACKGGDETTQTTAEPTTAAPTTAEVTTTTPAASTVTTAPVFANMSADEVAVRNLLDIFLHEVTAAYENPGVERPGLVALLDGTYKPYLTGQLAKYSSEGQYFKRAGGGVPRHETLEVAVNDPVPGSAVAIECLIDDRSEYRRGTDQPVDTSVSRLSFHTTATRGTDGQWRISDKSKDPVDLTVGQCRGLG